MTLGIRNHNLNLKLHLNRKLLLNKQNLSSLSLIISNLILMQIRISRIINKAKEHKAFNSPTVTLCRLNKIIKINKSKNKRLNNLLQ